MEVDSAVLSAGGAVKCRAVRCCWVMSRESGVKLRLRKELRRLALSGLCVEVSVFHGR